MLNNKQANCIELTFQKALNIKEYRFDLIKESLHDLSELCPILNAANKNLNIIITNFPLENKIDKFCKCRFISELEHSGKIEFISLKILTVNNNVFSGKLTKYSHTKIDIFKRGKMKTLNPPNILYCQK